MNVLVQSLAALGGLRDRDALDTELVRLVLTSAGVALEAATLIRIVGEGDERRCLRLADLQVGQAQPSRDVLWSDWSLLPHISDFPLRATALEKGRAAVSAGSPYQVVLPIGTTQGLQILLEVSAPHALTPTTIDLLQSILLTYQNLLGLLDYGERDSLTELLNRKTFDGAFSKPRQTRTTPCRTTCRSAATRRRSRVCGWRCWTLTTSSGSTTTTAT